MTLLFNPKLIGREFSTQGNKHKKILLEADLLSLQGTKPCTGGYMEHKQKSPALVKRG